MERRTFLGSLAASSALLAGCLDRPAAEAGTSTGSVTHTETPSSAGTADGTSERHITSAVARSYSHAIRLNDLGPSPRATVPRLAALSDRERAVARAAIRGTYETDSLPDWLVDFVSETRYVRTEGRYYRLDGAFPVTTVTATTVTAGEVTGEIATYDAYESAVTHDGAVRSGLLRNARDGGTELTDVWPGLRQFLDRYDAVRYRGELLGVSASTEDPGPPYTVSGSEVSLDTLADGPVWRLSDAPADVRQVVRAGADESGLYAFEDPPDGLLANLRDHEYVYVDGRFYTTYVEQAGSHPVSLSVSVEDGTLSDGARIRLTLGNDTDGAVTTTSGIPEPFGVLRYQGGDGDRTSGLLWADAYAEHEGVRTEGRDVVAVNSVAVTTRLGPGETAERTFAVEDATLEPGTYVVESDVGYRTATSRDGTFPYEVTFRVE